MRAGVLGLAGDAGIFIGQERGYFEQEGITVDVTILGAGPDAIPLLAAGQLEVGGPTPDASLLNAISRDVPIKIVADKGRYLSDRPTSAAFVVRKDLYDAGTIQSVADLQGRRVGVVAAQSSQAIDVNRLMEQGGLTERDVELVSMPFPDMLPALANRSIDAAQSVEPFVAFAVGQGVGVRWKGVEEITPTIRSRWSSTARGSGSRSRRPRAAGWSATCGAYATTTTRSSRIRGGLRSSRSSRNTPRSRIRPSSSASGPPASTRTATWRSPVSPTTRTGSWRRGVISQPQDLANVIDHQYVEYALQRLGEYR